MDEQEQVLNRFRAADTDDTTVAQVVADWTTVWEDPSSNPHWELFHFSVILYLSNQ